MISGGKNENGVLMNDVWVSDDAGTTWIQTTAAPWSARSAFGFASVPLGAPLAGRVVLVAGSTAPSVVTNDVWVSDSAADSLSGITWTQAVAVAPFSPRSKLGFVVMPDTGMLVVAGAFVRSFFSGSLRALCASSCPRVLSLCSNSSHTTPSVMSTGGESLQSTGTLVIALNDVWTSPSHGLEWTERHATAERWSPRSRFSFIALRPKPGFDGRILLIGGRNSTGTCLHDVWESSLKTIGSTWTPTVAPTVPTIAPTSAPVPSAPTVAPTAMPTVAPTSAAPTAAPTQIPTDAPTAEPTSEPTRAPVTQMPSAAPSAAPTRNATEDEAEEQRKAVRCCCVFLELIFVFIHTHTHTLSYSGGETSHGVSR